MPILLEMGAKLLLSVIVLALVVPVTSASAVAPLYNPVALNIGIACQWQPRCERQQLKAMQAANRFIASKRPPAWKIHTCNRNARRGTAKVDWVGFNGCIRNPRIWPPLPRRG
jgi:hypothetical protein